MAESTLMAIMGRLSAYSGKTLTWASRGLQALAAIIAMGIGLHIMVETGAVLFG